MRGTKPSLWISGGTKPNLWISGGTKLSIRLAYSANIVFNVKLCEKYFFSIVKIAVIHQRL